MGEFAKFIRDLFVDTMSEVPLCEELKFRVGSEMFA